MALKKPIPCCLPLHYAFFVALKEKKIKKAIITIRKHKNIKQKLNQLPREIVSNRKHQNILTVTSRTDTNRNKTGHDKLPTTPAGIITLHVELNVKLENKGVLRCSAKEVFLRISQYSHENSCEVSF